MASAGITYFPETGDELVDATTHGYMWVLGPDRTIDWALADGFDGEIWPDQTKAAAAEYVGYILGTISYAANIKFNYVGAYANPIAAAQSGSELTLSLAGSTTLFPSPSYWAMAFFPDDSYNTIYAGLPGDVFVNIDSPARYVSYEPGSAGWALILHEVGHALGLKHPHDDGGTGRPTLEDLDVEFLDVDWATVMSYRDDFQWNYKTWDPITPMVLDVLALQYLYGKNMSKNVGETELPIRKLPGYGTVWDASGNDTVTAAEATEGWFIALPNVRLSNLIDTQVGLAVPAEGGTSPTSLFWLTGDIENATGSAYSDTLVGSDTSNVLRGLQGNDTLDGGSGVDYAIFSGSPSQYWMTREADGAVTLTGPDGTDTLVSVERLQFDSTKIAIDVEGNAGQAYRLYKAAFDRLPDLGGLGYQMNALDTGLSLSQVAAHFIASPEFQWTYGAVNNRQFITLLYRNVLDRDPEGSGLQYHIDRLAAGASRADVLLGFSESPENKANVIGQIEYGMVYT